MYISKVKLTNYRCFDGEFVLELNPGMNIIVGDNEAGKSTILEAIHLALTGQINGKGIWNELSEYLFNVDVVNRFVSAVKTGKADATLPEIRIEIYLKSAEEIEESDHENHILAELRGDDNTDRDNDASGFYMLIAFNDLYRAEYRSFIESREEISSLPVEYYDVGWMTFARDPITPRGIPYKSALIDSASYGYYGGGDLYLSHIVRDILDPEEINAITQAHRKMRDEFRKDDAIKQINEKINTGRSLSEKTISLSVELVTKNAWQNSVITELDNIPFGYIGQGARSIVKTELALYKRTAQNAGIILLEEPENHLSHSRLNMLLKKLSENYGEKQFLTTTHSSFVANKLGLNNLILLENRKVVRFAKISSETQKYFKHIAGYDTLRLILCKKAVLCEGDSDELVLQRCYMNEHSGRLPIEDGIEVISVGTSFLRFLEIADSLHKEVSVVTDNDGDVPGLERKYAKYIDEQRSPKKQYVHICIDWQVDDGETFGEETRQKFNYNTLEPRLLKCNSLEKLNEIFGTTYDSNTKLLDYMHDHKTECALAIFETKVPIEFPDYIKAAFR